MKIRTLSILLFVICIVASILPFIIMTCRGSVEGMYSGLQFAFGALGGSKYQGAGIVISVGYLMCFWGLVSAIRKLPTISESIIAVILFIVGLLMIINSGPPSGWNQSSCSMSPFWGSYVTIGLVALIFAANVLVRVRSDE